MEGQKTRLSRRPRAYRWLALVVIVLAAGALSYLIVAHRRASRSPTPASVTTVVKHASFKVTVAGPGSLLPIRTVSLAPTVAGPILNIASVGDAVSAGQVVARLDPTAYQRAFDNAQLALQQAQASLASLQANQAKADATLTSQIAGAQVSLDAAQRAYDTQRTTTELTQTLFRMGSASASDVQNAQDALSNAAGTLNAARTSVSTLLTTQQLQATADQQDLESSRLSVAQAELSLKTAQQNLADTSLDAPFAGTVSAVDGAVGETAGAATALVTVVDDATVQLAAQIAEVDVTQVAVGQAASVSFDATSSRTFAGRVSSIAPTATLVSNIPIYYVTVDIPNADHTLRGGMTGQANIVTREIPNTFQVPARAVRTVNGSSQVLVRRPDGSYEPVRVAVVGTSGINSVLTGAVPDGGVVLVSGEAGTNGASSNSPAQGTTQRRNSAVPFGGAGGLRAPPPR
jgi:HlyD family secretion protein